LSYTFPTCTCHYNSCMHVFVLGKIRKVYVEYPQGWLSKLTEREGNAQAAWRTDPKKSGKSGCMGDIGTHAAHLAEYITGLEITHLCADLNVMVEGRMLDDDGNVLLKFNNGAAGVLMASQVAAGEENALKIRIYGEKGGLEWAQQEPNTLLVKWLDQPTQILRAGGNYGDRLSSFATANCRTPGGHPEVGRRTPLQLAGWRLPGKRGHLDAVPCGGRWPRQGCCSSPFF